jgi:DNA topoisomerase-1
MNTIRTREYTTLDPKKRFVPTELGMRVSNLLAENLPEIISVKFTAGMEEHLDKIAKGELDRDVVLREFYKHFEKHIAAFKKTDKRKPAEPTGIKCPSCGDHDLVIRIGRSGAFLGCAGYPECKFTSNFKRDEAGNIQLVQTEGPKMLDEKCPLCGKQLRQVIGKFGPFIACSGYPQCKYIKQIKADFPCPLDGGEVVRKQWKGRVFWGCANYPKCKFVVFGDIEQTPCPKCNAPFLVKKFDKQGNMTLFCNNKECGYTTAQKDE